MRSILSGCLFIALLATLTVACHSGDKPAVAAAMADSARYTSIRWLDSSSRDFGKIQEGDKLDVSFQFRNTGTTPLVIGRVQPTCGCTIAEQPEAPIAPGSEGKIRATFNSQGHAGVNHKSLIVTANTRGGQSYSLHFVVLVEKRTS